MLPLLPHGQWVPGSGITGQLVQGPSTQQRQLAMSEEPGEEVTPSLLVHPCSIGEA